MLPAEEIAGKLAGRARIAGFVCAAVFSLGESRLSRQSWRLSELQQCMQLMLRTLAIRLLPAGRIPGL